MRIIIFIIIIIYVLSDYRDDDYNYGNTVIVISNSRSGSSFLCNLLNKLGHVKGLSAEILGGNSILQKKIHQPIDKAQLWLKLNREKYPDPGNNIIGFKWKAVNDFRQWPAQVNAWEWIKYKGFKLIYNTRNQLDRYISFAVHNTLYASKHQTGQHTFICDKSNIKCIEEKVNTTIHINITDVLLWLDEETLQRSHFESDINSIGVEYLHNDYDALTTGSDESKIYHLQKIADYIFINNTRKMTMNDFEVNISITHDVNKGQAGRIYNYEELVLALSNTQYKSLLHSDY